MSLSPEEIEYYKEHASDSVQTSIIASQTIPLVLAYIFVGLRVWARKVGKTPFSYDDWLIIAALVPLSTHSIVGWIQVTFGEGKHIIFVTNKPGFVQAYVAAIVAYASTVILTKLSILCFYCRIFSPIQRLKYISWALSISIVAYNLALILVAAFECIPLSSLWTGNPGNCINTLPPFTTLGIVNVVTDVGILALPIRYVILLRLSLTRRIQVCGIFLSGALVCVFGIIRVVALAQAPEGDPSYNQVWSGIWSFCETAIGIVAACLPTLAVLVTKSHLSKVLSSVAHLLSIPFHGSPGDSGSNTGASERSINEIRSDENEYPRLSEWSLVKGTSSDSRNPMHPSKGDVLSFAAGSATERGI
ncbi:hypothetical protein F5Y09DRAFT_329720 [Xylaria sp. FL1042]|nr:hypothetical protein F5Y09DRAFT_329720 [Xylaria sp. FL1042]